MRYTTYDSWAPVRRQFQREINRALNTHGDEEATFTSFTPNVDISETSERWLLAAELPGVSVDEIEITTQNDSLTIKGRKSAAQSDDESVTQRRNERVYGEFVRQFSLPKTVNTQDITATSKDGVLHISIPKQAEVQPKRIPVSQG